MESQLIQNWSITPQVTEQNANGILKS